MSASSSVSSPQQVESRTCKCRLIARYFVATTPMNGGRHFYKYRRLGSNSYDFWEWIDRKLPTHVSMMIHNQKIELDSIRNERDHLKKLLEDMGGIESSELNNDSDLKDMAATEIVDLKKVSILEDKMSNLELKGGIESYNLNDKVLNLDLKVHRLISLLLISWSIIIGFVAAKMM